MNATTVFQDRKEEFLAQLQGAQDVPARIAAAQFVLEQIACVAAQEEQDDAARQRQQAVLAAMRRTPSLLCAAGARGELVFATPQSKNTAEKSFPRVKMAGAAILALLAAYELIDGQLIFAALQLLGSGLALFGGGALSALLPAAQSAQARGVMEIDAKALLDEIESLCRAADVCVNDLSLLDKEASLSRLSGTADEATLDLLVAMLEAKASGRQDAAARTLGLAEQYLRMLGVDAVFYSEESAAYFDVLPTLSGERTIRPALIKDGMLIRRGVAAKAMERSVGA